MSYEAKPDELPDEIAQEKKPRAKHNQKTIEGLWKMLMLLDDLLCKHPELTWATKGKTGARVMSEFKKGLEKE